MTFLSRISLANRSLVALATIGVLLFGAILIPQIKQELYPSIEFPTVSVISTYAGASPAIVEQNITNPLEQSFQGVQGVQQITSYSNEGASIIEVQYNYGTDLTQASQTLAQQINKVQQSLPSGVAPQVQTFSISDLPVIQLAVSSSANSADLATALHSDVVPVLQGISGVASVNITGVRNQIVTVALDLTKLQSEGLGVTQVQQALQANNTTLPAGELTNNGQTLAIRVGNSYGSLSDLQNVVVGEHIVTTIPPGCSAQLPAGLSSRSGNVSGRSSALTTGASCTPLTTSTPVKLSDIATVQQALAPSSSLTRTNGKDSLGISITKNTDGNTVNISQAVHNDITSFERTLGHSATITVVSDQAPSINSAISSLVREGLIGALFAIAVILLFLFSLRSTLVTAISIPLSIVIALIGIWVGNYTLNLFTLGGLTIAIGRVVDDSIVVLENIYRHMSNGEEKRVAIPGAVREVAGAVTASTLTTVCVFLPIAFTGGLVGQVFNPFAVTVTIALLASLFVALTVIPVLAYWFLKAPKSAALPGGHEKTTFLQRGYVPVVRWVTGHTAITLSVAFILFIGSFALIPRLGTNFFGAQRQNTFSISETLPSGSSLSVTDAAAQKVESVLAGIPQIQTYQVTVGGGSGFAALLNGGGGYNTASFAITIDSNADPNAVQQTLQSRLNGLSGAGALTLNAGGGGGFNSSNIAINVQASDPATLQQAAQQVLSAVQRVPNTANVSSNLTNAAPLIDVTVDSSKAASHGLTAAQVGQLVRAVYTGATVTTVTLNGQQENVTLFLGSPANNVQDMQNMLLPAQGGDIKLGDLASVTQTTGPTQITHIGGARTATISATATSQNVGGVTRAIQQKLKDLSLPSGVTVSQGGVASNQSQAFNSLGIALLAAIILVYLVMVGTFRSLVQPLILLVSIPFAGTGSILLLLATHTQLGVPALIGLLMLVGIVVTNAIVLLDLVHQYRLHGLDARSAAIEGGRRRLRPILMTAIATILALTPMASGLSQSSGFIAAPLALTVIGGLTTSTILTLLLVPTLYVLIEGRKERGKGKSQPGQAAKDDTVQNHEVQQQETIQTAQA